MTISFNKPVRFLAILFLVAGLVLPVSAAHIEVGVGANYWYALDDAIDQSFDEDGLGWLVSTRFMFTDYLGIGLELERSPDNFIQFDEPMYSPAAYLILGNGIYAAIGVGTYYYDGDFYSDCWYALRAGLKIPLFVDAIVLDINANYRCDSWKDIGDAKDEIDTDNVILGAAIRLVF